MKHSEQKEEIFAQLAAEFINTQSNRQSLITVTRASLSSDSKRATLFVSVLPEDKETEVLEFLRRQVAEFRTFAKQNARTRVIPFFSFEIDAGEKNRQAVEVLSDQDKSLE